MKPPPRDPSLDMLLDLDGEFLVIDPAGEHWVRFRVKPAPPTLEKPQGLDYVLMLHETGGTRLLGFDNAHPVRSAAGPAARRSLAPDHRHRHRTIRPYEYRDAARLLADFRTEVEAVLAERGVTP